jgi:hypothetical protein
VFRPKTFTPDKLLEGYFRVLKQAYTVPAIFQRLWGTTAWKNFFWPMNFGFRHSAHALCRVYRKGGMRVAETIASSLTASQASSRSADFQSALANPRARNRRQAGAPAAPAK